MENLNEHKTEKNGTLIGFNATKLKKEFRSAAQGDGCLMTKRCASPSWLSFHNNNNSINVGDNGKSGRSVKDDVKCYNCESCDEASGGVSENISAKDIQNSVEDKGGGHSLQKNDDTANDPIMRNTLSALAALVIPPDAFGAASLTPPDDFSPHSNRTSLNNSTENLSYSSDNYYPDNLLLLDDGDDEDDKLEGEEVSLNSDDCIYAYRGEGADFDLALDPTVRGGIGVGMLDDETDFLEMDFEPDPLSEMEYNATREISPPPHSDAFLLQRDACQLSGAGRLAMNTSGSLQTTPTQRQLFSSPIDDMTVASKALQSQGLLNKDFATITMHLDQIKGSSGDCVFDEHKRLDSISVKSASVTEHVKDSTVATAHSLPNTLHARFGHNSHDSLEEKTSPSKVTGAKPKRFSTLSTSTSSSSKNSLKTRNSTQRLSYASVGTSCSFDERSASCTEFRCVAPKLSSVSTQLPSAELASNTYDEFGINDETCWDCLEKEFLANTIGKALDPNQCPKCRTRSRSININFTQYKRAEHVRCRSGSPRMFFADERNDLFEDVRHNFYNSQKSWTPGMIGVNKPLTVVDKQDKSDADRQRNNPNDQKFLEVNAAGDNFNGELLLKNLLQTEKEIFTISTINLSDDKIAQALGKLNISFDLEMLKTHFKICCSNSSPSASLHAASETKFFKSLKHFVLHESKKPFNKHKIEILIKLVTQQQVEIRYIKDKKLIEPETVNIRAVDLLEQWSHTKDLNSLKKLDKRFTDANVLGKVANIIRQAQQRCSSPKRMLPEFITIPQYYASGYLSLTKKH